MTSLGGFLRGFSPVYGKFLFRLPHGAEVLDVGCGDCASLRIISTLRPDVSWYGVDIEESPSGKGILKEFRRADLNSELIDFPEGKFDGVRICHVLEHLTGLNVLQREIGRLLKPGGMAYVETPNENSLRVPSFSIYRKQGGCFNFRDDPSHVRPFRTEELREFVAGSGLDVLVSEVVRNPWKILLSPVILLIGLIARRRSWLTAAVWEVTGWCSCAVGRKPADGERGVVASETKR
jgi:SAM-dependent methyltransferase